MLVTLKRNNVKIRDYQYEVGFAMLWLLLFIINIVLLFCFVFFFLSLTRGGGWTLLDCVLRSLRGVERVVRGAPLRLCKAVNRGPNPVCFGSNHRRAILCRRPTLKLETFHFSLVLRC